MPEPSLDEQILYLDRHLDDCRDHVARIKKFGYSQVLDAAARWNLRMAEAVKESLCRLKGLE